MDFLDPKKQKAHSRRLLIGYVLMGLALIMATTVLLYQAYGFGIDRHGRVIQNGLIFMSSHPEGATIYANGVRQDSTNTRLTIPAGPYTFELRRDGYHTWKRAVTVDGGSLQRFDYPFLFPTKLTTTTTKQYTAAPSAVLQSPDHRWLLVPASADSFDRFDLREEAPQPEVVTIPAEILSASSTTVGWEQIEWAKDNRHAMLKRLFEKDGQKQSEYILFDHQEPAASRNISVALGFTPSEIKMRDKAFDQYYAFDQVNGILFTASLDEPTPKKYLENVLAFAADGKDTVLYATTAQAHEGSALIRLRAGKDSYTVRQVANDSPHLLKIARYEGNTFIAAGAQSEGRVYVYKNPLPILKDSDKRVLVPIHVLKTPGPTYIEFSNNARFIMVENADQFAVYDAETDRGYAYQLGVPLEAVAPHATWMDGHRLGVTSGGKIIIFDFDGTNRQTLVTTNPAYIPYFDPNYRFMYTITPESALSSTALRTARDL